jgi:hypothetical protein
VIGYVAELSAGPGATLPLVLALPVKPADVAANWRFSGSGTVPRPKVEGTKLSGTISQSSSVSIPTAVTVRVRPWPPKLGAASHDSMNPRKRQTSAVLFMR